MLELLELKDTMDQTIRGCREQSARFMPECAQMVSFPTKNLGGNRDNPTDLSQE
jgi:hypothetical protein